MSDFFEGSSGPNDNFRVATPRQKELIRILWRRYSVHSDARNRAGFMYAVCGCRQLSQLSAHQADDVTRQLRYNLGLPGEGGSEKELVGLILVCKLLWIVCEPKNNSGCAAKRDSLSEWVREHFDIGHLELAEPSELNRVIAALKILAR